jgi:hypothetical protein
MDALDFNRGIARKAMNKKNLTFEIRLAILSAQS